MIDPYEKPQQIALQAFGDNRGTFFETYNKKKLEEKGIKNTFCQDNFSFSALKNTIRGLHFQTPPTAQSKLVISIRGKILDVIVDLRQSSPTFLKVYKYVLDAQAPSCLYVPKGFAHGFCTLEDNVCVLYKVDDFYSPQDDGGIIWNDPDLNIEWPLDGEPVLSDKDAKLPRLKQLDIQF